MISSLTLTHGRTPGQPAEKIEASPITIFVGPNNSGKSRALKDIENTCKNGQANSAALIVQDLDFSGFTDDCARERIASITATPHPDEVVAQGSIVIHTQSGRSAVPLDTLTSALLNPASNRRAFCLWFLASKTTFLDGHSRISLINDREAGDLQKPPKSSLQALFTDDDKRSEVRRIIYEAFGSHFVIDPTKLGTLRIRLSRRAPQCDSEERGITNEAVRFHGSAQPISLASDGVKAFTGMIMEVIAGDPQVMIIDEPEAFLHPSLATKLGLELSRIANRESKRVFIATHSPHFLMGCIQSGTPVTIIRLTYRDDTATARSLPSDDILKLMRNPLLRSTGVLGALFYENAVVTEADSDRAFYQEVNERLLRYKPEWGIPNCLFLNAQNKQTIHTILRPLRKLGIPAAGIVDVDVFKEGGQPWSSLISSAGFPEISHAALSSMRNEILHALKITDRDMKRDGGIAILPPSEREAAQNLLDQLLLYGILVVPGGELESWLRELGATRHGPAWLIQMFERMGENADGLGYLKPDSADVWAFIGKARNWLMDPSRKGIPS